MDRLTIYLLVAAAFQGVTGSMTAQESVADTVEMKELKNIEIFASYSNRAFDEPVVVSSIYHGQIESKISNLEFPEVLRFVPSTYVSRKGGGYGDSRITLRGFSSENSALTINGIPVNGMENGTVYWSNWAGLADVAAAVQVQRGIGLSNRAIPSAGGTINILTLGSHAQKGGSVFYGLGNDGYEKMALNFSTGLINGWNFTFAGSRTKGDGYVVATDFEAWSYFGELSKIINPQHTLSLTAFGAPQWHNGGGNKKPIAVYESHKDGIRMNTDYGYLHGKPLSTTNSGYNKYHKPQVALNHYWTIDDRSSLMTSFYFSIAQGGGQRPYGLNAKTPEGLTDFEAIMKENAAHAATGAIGYLTMNTNSHKWYGLISTYSRDLTESLHFKAGFDGRYYVGDHYEEISDLLGAVYYRDQRGLAYRAPGNDSLKVGDRINLDFQSRILQYGAFGELVYEKPVYKTFLTFALSDYAYQRKDPGKYGPYSNQEIYPMDKMTTHWKHFVPITLKGGINYKFLTHHRAFFNAGYMTRAPRFDNFFFDNNPASDLIMEKTITAEVGYGFHNRYLDVSLGAYYTRWNDKSTTFLDRELYERRSLPNVDALHEGIELEVVYRPIRSLRLGGYLSVNNYRWLNDVTYLKINAAGEKVGSFEAYIEDLHVGDVPQTSAALNAEWEILRGLKVAADFNYYARHYSNYYLDNRTNPNDRADSWKLPDFGTVDVRAQYVFKIAGLDATVYGNVNNLFNKEYISEATDGANHERSTAKVWYGFGRTWTSGLRVRF